MAATLPPAPQPPEPGQLWQSFTITLYVPTSGRCDQHAVVIDGQVVGLLSATQIGVKVREMIVKRPSFDALAAGACVALAVGFGVLRALRTPAPQRH